MLKQELWQAIPTLNNQMDFTNLPVALNERDIFVLSRINGMLSLGELVNLLHIERGEMEVIFAKLVKHELVFLDNYEQTRELLHEVYGGEEAQPGEAAPAFAAEAEEAPARESAAPKKSLDDATTVETGQWDIDSFFGLIHRLYLEKRTGILRIFTDQKVYKALFFEAGALLNVSSVPFMAAECLGRIIQQAGYINQEKVIESLQRAKRNNTRQGEELVAMGAMRRDLLPEMLRIQVEVKLTEVMHWESGDWMFQNLPALPLRISRIDIDLPRLLFNLIWKRYPMEKIDRELRERQEKFVGRSSRMVYDASSYSFGEGLEKFFQIILEKDNPLKRLQIISNLKPPQTARMIWALYLTGAIDFFDESRQDKVMAEIETLKEQIKNTERETYFDTLHTHWTVGDEGIEKAFKQWSGEEERAIVKTQGLVQQLHRTLLARIHAAYETLRTREGRRQYRAEIYDPDFILFGSEILRQKGESYLFTKEAPELAAPELESAIEIYDRNGEYFSELGLAYFLRDYPRNFRIAEEGRRLVKKGLAMNSGSEVVHLCVGLLYRHEKKNKQAIEALEKVLKINPDNRFAKILLNEIKSGVTSEEREKAAREFLERKNQADEKLEKLMAEKREAGGKKPEQSAT